MKPVAIFRHAPSEGAGFFSEFLKQHNISMELIKIDEGAEVPRDPLTYGGLVFMGGSMSVNDELPWIDPVCSLIREAVANNVPVLGHCLGGQLMSKALGGTVGRNPVKEMGRGQHY
jgi:GMP synthase-like glutamine amidotransferase